MLNYVVGMNNAYTTSLIPFCGPFDLGAECSVSEQPVENYAQKQFVVRIVAPQSIMAHRDRVELAKHVVQ